MAEKSWLTGGMQAIKETTSQLESWFIQTLFHAIFGSFINFRMISIALSLAIRIMEVVSTIKKIGFSMPKLNLRMVKDSEFT